MGYMLKNMLARDMIKQFMKGYPPFQAMQYEDAIKSANMGCPTVAGLLEPDHKHSHVMMVLPQEAGPVGGLKVAQAGARNGFGLPLAGCVGPMHTGRVMYWGAP